MPPRDEHDYEQRRQQILDGALEAFAEKGFDGASNKDIAQAAGIASPGLIYHYFKDKFDLLHRMLETRMPVLRLIDEVEAALDGPPEVVLPDLALKILRAYEQWPAAALLKVALVESARNPRVAQMVNEIGPGRGLRVLSRYLAGQMAAGRLRPMNPDVATRAFVGPLIAYSLTRTIFDDPQSRVIGLEAMAQGASAIFLRGMAPEQPEG